MGKASSQLIVFHGLLRLNQPLLSLSWLFKQLQHLAFQILINLSYRQLMRSMVV